MTDAMQVVTTTDDQQEAERIAKSLVERRLAACVQVGGPVNSTYWWKDDVETSQEWLCTIKTHRELYSAVEQAIRELHSYDEPEILATAVVAASESYLKWLASEVDL